jgi:hypothetical protein
MFHMATKMLDNPQLNRLAESLGNGGWKSKGFPALMQADDSL